MKELYKSISINSLLEYERVAIAHGFDNGLSSRFDL